ncbi:MAG: hypothetical protein BWY52_01948 [Chloroflexi bacterium ADurb.Bin325]|nr:MAG: hypothetical protein BWY52_01948 [Chloroflexi bacterium ADurb.Bin325]
MHDHAQRIHRVLVDQHVEPDHVRRAIALHVIVQAGIAAAARLQLVVEVGQDLNERDVIAQQHPALIQILLRLELPAAVRHQIHHDADILRGREHVDLHPRLADLRDHGRVGQLDRAVDHHLAAVGQGHLVLDARRGEHQIQVVLALQPLLDDLHVEQAQEAAAEPIAERLARLRLKGQGRVVELELRQRIAQRQIIRRVARINAGEHHRLHGLVARQRLLRGVDPVRQGIAHPAVAHHLEPGRQIADLARFELARGPHVGAEHAHLQRLQVLAGGHELQGLARLDAAIDDPHIRHDALVGIVMAVEDERAQRLVALAVRRRHLMDDGFEQRGDVGAILGRDAQHLLVGRAQDILDLLRHGIGRGGDQIDLVDDRDDLQVVLHRQIEVRQGLRLDPLRGVHDQHRALACVQGPADLVGEVHVAGRVDQVELVGAPVVRGVVHPHRGCLDRHTLLAFQIHAVQHLADHLALGDGAGDLQQAVGQGGFSVVNMRDDAEIADILLIHRPLLSEDPCLARLYPMPGDSVNKNAPDGASPKQIIPPIRPDAAFSGTADAGPASVRARAGPAL